MEIEEDNKQIANEPEDEDEEVDPIHDIIDYLVRCARVSFKNAHIDQVEIRTSQKVQMACDLFKRSPTDFLLQFGKRLAPNHLSYFERLQPEDNSYQECITQLKLYHSDVSTRKRVRNRRYKALQKLQDESDYFSEKEMMYRNPLLYEQLVGQYLTDDEIRERDGVDNENLTFLNMILETVDRNKMRETKNEQRIAEDMNTLHIESNTQQIKPITTKEPKSERKQWGEYDTPNVEAKQSKTPRSQWGDFETPDIEEKESNTKRSLWGDFKVPDATPSFKPEVRKQTMISAPERRLLREEFLQEMYSSFIEGLDEEMDYSSIDNDEQYDDLAQATQDAEDQYFDSEGNDVENLEEHMSLVQEYGQRNSIDGEADPLDEFMHHITIRQST